MRRCLSENILLRLAAGGGSVTQRLHLEACPSCAKRYEDLAQHLADLEQILRGPPPAVRYVPVSSSQFAFRYKFPLAMAAAVLLMLGWGWFWSQKPKEGAATRTPNTEVLYFFEEEVVPALFATVNASEPPLPVAVSDAAYVEAALAGGWPCESPAVLRISACEIYPFPLLISEQ